MSTDILPTPNSGAMGNPQFLSQGNIPHSLTHTHMHKTESLFPHKVRGDYSNVAYNILDFLRHGVPDRKALHVVDCMHKTT